VVGEFVEPRLELPALFAETGDLCTSLLISGAKVHAVR
jgi:hypothetical protein